LENQQSDYSERPLWDAYMEAIDDAFRNKHA
jgi:hypothetical protein